MIKLKLRDALTAEIYGLPQEDTTDEAIIQAFLKRGGVWDAEAVNRLISDAITAGAYTATQVKPQEPKEK